ncbi:hypothetical protein PV327_001958 [Microctonus hyperodae]|uniref:MYND-type domain-containing protein n=1 Tax=Microctonus hyperodae TaxID=165561 RepID=A0AA39FEK1_MICHY|nr:hypothetical protein PV327_001958 [Microctonus hyperodae]
MNFLGQIFSRYNEWRKHFLCHTEPLIALAKTDEDKINVVLEYLVSTGRILNIQNQNKNTTKAREYIEEGEQKLEVQLWSDAVRIFTKAIMHAEINSNELARGYINRSVALCKSGKYENALSDIERASKMNCNDNEKALLFTTRAKCLHAIENIMDPEHVKAFEDANQWNGNSNNVDISEIHNISFELLDDSSGAEPPRFEYDSNDFLREPLKDNLLISIEAWNTVQLKCSKKFGRHVVAKRNIEPGEALSVYKAYTAVIDYSYRHIYCWNCCKQTWSGVACHQCVNVIYCDENCRDKAWREHHDIECPVISTISSKELNSYDLLALRLTVKACKEAGTLENLEEKIHQIEGTHGSVHKRLTNNVFEPTLYASVYSLRRNTQEFFVGTERASVILYSLAATTNLFGEKISDLRWLIKNKYAAFIGGLIKRNYEISLINSNKLSYNGDVGLVLDSFWPLFNHRPTPTVINFASGKTSYLIAFQRISKGQQIFLSCEPEFIYDKYGKRWKKSI